jgi:hypothetical protein
MIDELGRPWTKLSRCISRYYPIICLQGLRKTTENLSHDSWSPEILVRYNPILYNAQIELRWLSQKRLIVIIYESESKNFRTGTITKYTLTFGITRWEATQRVMEAKFTRPTHEIAIQLHLVAESCTICNSCSRRPVRKLLDTPSYVCMYVCM